MIIARRIGRFRETFPVLLGTLVSQTVFNILALCCSGWSSSPRPTSSTRSSEHLFLFSFAPALLLVAVAIAPALVARDRGRAGSRRRRGAVRDALVRVRLGLAIFRDPRRGPLGRSRPAHRLGDPGARPVTRSFAALGLARRRWGSAAAAAVLFAVNVTAVDPGDAVEHRRLPARDDQRPDHGLRGRRRPMRSPTA